MMIAQGADPNFLMYAGSAVFLVGLAWFAMRWMSRTVKKDLDPSNAGRMRESMALKADVLPPALVKEALSKGLVSSAQLATMSPVERQFLFTQLRSKLTGAPTPAVPPPLSNTHLPLKPTASAAPHNAPHNAPQLRNTQAITAIPGKPMSLPPLTPEQIVALGHPPGQARNPAAPPARPRSPTPPGAVGAVAGHDPFAEPGPLVMFCPCCGTQLTLPAFPPFVAFCDQCGAKTAVRTEQQGRLVINTAPPGVTRRPIG
ncbi:MAG: hypothetical protein O2973_04320 [Gemmatimonadetes bacterium]|nr:hypothetical protein [Gemmatimonadota bacterium]